jgi:hypothetical protein
MFNFHIDPGHGWVEVTIQVLKDLEISDKISHFSYRDWDNCYLEEDCDAAVFQNAYEARYGKKPEYNIVRYDGNAIDDPYCFIRELDDYYA